MGIRIQNNITALNTHRSLQLNNTNLSKSLERLSSGFRINRASDDAAGLAVSMRFRSQIGSLQQGSRNATEAISMLQIAEGASDQITNILQRMKELATQAASSNTSSADRSNIATEVTSLRDEITRIAGSTKYSGTTLIDGTFGTLGISSAGDLAPDIGITNIDVSGAATATSYSVTATTSGNNVTLTVVNLSTNVSQSITKDVSTITGFNTADLDFSSLGIKVTIGSNFDGAESGGGLISTTLETNPTMGASSFQIGYEDASNNRIEFSLSDLTATGLGVNAIDVSTLSGAQTALGTIDTAINTLANARAEVGRAQNRFDFANANLSSTIENLSAAESVIRDADMALETVGFTKNRILLQAGTAMLAQANSAPEAVLSLLR